MLQEVIKQKLKQKKEETYINVWSDNLILWLAVSWVEDLFWTPQTYILLFVLLCSPGSNKLLHTVLIHKVLYKP